MKKGLPIWVCIPLPFSSPSRVCCDIEKKPTSDYLNINTGSKYNLSNLTWNAHTKKQETRNHERIWRVTIWCLNRKKMNNGERLGNYFLLIKKNKDKGYFHYKKGWKWVNNSFTIITVQIIYLCIVSQILIFFNID